MVLLAIQLYAALTTYSVSIFATLADAFMDLLSNIVLIVAGRVSKHQAEYKYPTGKAKMETAGIIVFACLMATLSIQIVIESCKILISQQYDVVFNLASYIAIGCAICLLYITQLRNYAYF